MQVSIDNTDLEDKNGASMVTLTFAIAMERKADVTRFTRSNRYTWPEAGVTSNNVKDMHKNLPFKSQIDDVKVSVGGSSVLSSFSTRSLWWSMLSHWLFSMCSNPQNLICTVSKTAKDR